MSQKSKRRAQRDGSVDNSPEPTNKAEEFAELLVYAFGNAEVTKKLREALGLNEQLENLQAEVEALRKAVRARDEAMVNLKKEMVTLHTEHDELDQYTRRNSVTLTGLTEATNENVYDIVMTIFNEEIGVIPPISPQEIDRIHRVGKPDPTKKRSILIKFAT